MKDWKISFHANEYVRMETYFQGRGLLNVREKPYRILFKVEIHLHRLLLGYPDPALSIHARHRFRTVDGTDV